MLALMSESENTFESYLVKTCAPMQHKFPSLLNLTKVQGMTKSALM